MKLNCSAIMVISALLTGCAHPIIISPDEQKISSNLSSNDNREYTVGYYISPKDKALEVTTLGGGGDNVRYYPYRDIEKGYKAMLSNVFVSVTKLDSIDKSDSQLQNKIDLILTPKIITTSGSTGFFTWPPTNFSVDLTNTITSVDGKIISEPRAVGTGGASTSEKLSEHGIAGRRAIEDALLKSQVMLFNVELPQKKNSTNLVKSAKKESSDASILERLKSLKELKDSGLINEEEFKSKKKEIIESL
ncbi:SHOCT domain-containing protein [Psychromonas sp. B3M02]|uniref:SHOCT domain-containing protein n=1 Tax=Psychromonas sp. B3M02 TaxID=2267226 RepID=UPI001C68FEB6|nr:SHOCT domain-containing protein [Psychromonas sp. B3M02]